MRSARRCWRCCSAGWAGGGSRRGLSSALAICAVLLAVAPFFEWMVVVRTVLAVAAGTLTGTAVSTAAMLAPAGQRGRSMQVITMGQSIAALVGVPLGAWVATQFSWRINYGAIAAMAAAASLALYLGLPRGMLGDTQIDARAPAGAEQSRRDAGAALDAAVHGGRDAGLDLHRRDDDGGRGRASRCCRWCSSRAGSARWRRGSRQGGSPTASATGRRRLATSVAVMMTLSVLALLPMLPAGLHLPVLLVAFAIHAYVVWTFSIAVQSQLAHLAPSSVPVAISLNMSGFNIAMAIAAAAAA